MVKQKKEWRERVERGEGTRDRKIGEERVERERDREGEGEREKERERLLYDERKKDILKNTHFCFILSSEMSCDSAGDGRPSDNTFSSSDSCRFPPPPFMTSSTPLIPL